MKPDIKALLNEAKRPHQKFIPARAGWDGPEEKSAVATVNPTYEQLRHEPSPAELREILLSAATPDWRICLMIGAIIATSRAMRQKEPPRSRAPEVIIFPDRPSESPSEDACAA